MEDFYNDMSENPVHSFLNDIPVHPQRNGFLQESSDEDPNEIVHDRFERYAEHSQDNKFFENLASDLKLSEEDEKLLNEIQSRLHPN